MTNTINTLKEQAARIANNLKDNTLSSSTLNSTYYNDIKMIREIFDIIERYEYHQKEMSK